MQLGVLPILGIIFVTLKLTGNIAWSWWWVLAPFYGTFALGLILLLIAASLESGVKANRRKPY